MVWSSVMSCECYRIGGRFIAEDPDCPAHGREAQEKAARRDTIVSNLRDAMECGDDLYSAAEAALDFLESL